VSQPNSKKQNLIKGDGLTYDDYASIDNGYRYELARGQLELMSPAPLVIHQLVSFEMHKRINRSCESEYIILYAPVDIILSPAEEVRQPNLILVHRDRMNIIKRRGIEGPPDLIVEILSPSTLKQDKIDKLKTYAHYNIPEYWIVDPISGILEQYTIDKDRYEMTNIFQGTDSVSSPNISYVSFTMEEIMDSIPNIQD